MYLCPGTEKVFSELRIGKPWRVRFVLELSKNNFSLLSLCLFNISPDTCIIWSQQNQ